MLITFISHEEYFMFQTVGVEQEGHAAALAASAAQTVTSVNAANSINIAVLLIFIRKRCIIKLIQHY